MNIAELCTKLDEYGYIADERLGRQIKGALAVRPIAGAFLFGRAGTGKTFLPESLAQVMNAKTYFYQCFPQTREEDLLYKLLPSEDTVSGIQMITNVIPRAIESSLSGLTFLILDEWDKTRPSADSFLLDFLQHGRIHYNGVELIARAENLKVWITMNDERDLSEPLLRRLPKIDFKPLAPSLVYKALHRTHPNHPLLQACVTLYVKAVLADLDKPATIQELRQLLDAASDLGESADWGELVYQFVSKTFDNHKRISESQIDADVLKQKFGQSITSLDISDFSREVKFVRENTQWVPKLPTNVRPLIPIGEEMNLAKACGILPSTPQMYSAALDLAEPDDNPAMFGDWAIVYKKAIELTKPIPLRDRAKANAMWDRDGEIMFSEPDATREDVMALRNGHGVTMYKVSRDEVCGKVDGALWIRWTKHAGAEIIVNLQKQKIFIDVFAEWIRHDLGKLTINALVSWKDVSPIARRRWAKLINQSNHSRYGQQYSMHAGGWHVSWSIRLLQEPQIHVSVGAKIIAGDDVPQFLGVSIEGLRGLQFQFSAENYAESHRVINAILAEECHRLNLEYRAKRAEHNRQVAELKELQGENNVRDIPKMEIESVPTKRKRKAKEPDAEEPRSE